MDNITHSLVGVALSRAGCQRVVPHATLLLILAANIPDIDILALAGGQLADLELHRGYTHTLLAIPILSAFCVAITMLIVTQRLPIFKAWLVGCLGVASHLLLDLFSSFGIRPLLPFSSRWYYLDLNGFYDGVILVALTLALLWPWFVDLVSSEIGKRDNHRGQGSAIAVLLFLLFYEGARWTLHEKALNNLSSRLYDGEVPIEVSALAQPNNPFVWTGIIETQDAYRIVKTGILDLTGASDVRIFRKPAKTMAYKEAMLFEPFRYMAYFSRFPVWGVEPVRLDNGIGKLMDLTDLRFGTPGEGEFHACALVDASGHVVDVTFGFSTAELQALRQGLLLGQ